MARKIIPIRSQSPLQKKSPFKAWKEGDKQYGRRGIKNPYYKHKKEELGGQFDTMKQDLMDEKVDMNFYEDLASPYAGLDDPFASLENTAEDLTVNQKQFQQQERLLQQGLSQTLQSSKESGTQNVQAIANQLSQSSGDIAASIGDQESANQKMKVAQAGELQLRKAGSKRDTDLTIRKGEHDTKMKIIEGEEDALSRKLNKQQALLALVSGEQANVDAQKANKKKWHSDRRLKKNIVLVSKSPSGINIYNFEYKNAKYGEGIYQGVMSDEIPRNCVIKQSDGYDMVDYSELDVNFIKI